MQISKFRVISFYILLAVSLVISSSLFGAPKKEDVPSSEISGSVVDALAAGDLDGAIIAMRDEKNSPKLLYLIREVTRVASLKTQEKPNKLEAHKVYQNAAVSYHNIYLFLKSRGIEQKDFLKFAHKYYKKAGRAAAGLHRMDCTVLDAAITAASGDIEEAKKKFSRIDEDLMRGDFESMEYLAAYHAAIGDVDVAVALLSEAYRLNPASLMTWLAVGDDFYQIGDDPRFEELLVSWKAREAEKRLSLSLPKTAGPKLEVADETGIFRPQKSIPHYKLKKTKAKSKAKTKAKTKTPAKKR